MQCPNCGNLLAEGSRFCPYCGSILEKSAGETQNEAFSDSDETLSVPDRQSSYGGWDPYGREPLSTKPDDPLNDPRGMKWFKFIIYFQLFASAVMNGYNAFQLFSGNQYEGTAKTVYFLYPGLKTADTIYGFVVLGLAALAIFVRFRLAQFRKDGPVLYYALMVADVLSALLYLFLASSATGLPLDQALQDSSILATLAGAGIMLIVNMIYFGRRKDLFIN